MLGDVDPEDVAVGRDADDRRPGPTRAQGVGSRATSAATTIHEHSAPAGPGPRRRGRRWPGPAAAPYSDQPPPRPRAGEEEDRRERARRGPRGCSRAGRGCSRRTSGRWRRTARRRRRPTSPNRSDQSAAVTPDRAAGRKRRHQPVDHLAARARQRVDEVADQRHQDVVVAGDLRQRDRRLLRVHRERVEQRRRGDEVRERDGRVVAEDAARADQVGSRGGHAERRPTISSRLSGWVGRSPPSAAASTSSGSTSSPV